MLLAPSAQAANIEVNTLADDESDGCGTGACTLRDAVIDAVANSEDDLITFESGLSGTINLAMGEIDLSDPTYAIEIRETGPNQVRVSGDATGNGPDAGDSRIFTVYDEGPITLDGMSLIDGYTADAGGAIYADGGGFGSAGSTTVTVANSEIRGNYAEGPGGGIASIAGKLTVTDSTITDNESDEFGGGIASLAALTAIEDSEISGNVARSFGGGIANKYGRASITGSEVSGNDADYAGGGIVNAIGALVVDESEISGNGLATPDVGGGIANFKYASATITSSTITGNRAAYAGGGLAHFNGVYGGKYGGGSPFETSTVVEQTTVIGNVISEPDGVGGGLFIGPGGYGDSVLVNRSTINANQARGNDASGGGIAFVPGNGTAELRSSTVSTNAASFGGGISFGYADGPIITPMPLRAEARREMRAAGIEPGSLEPPQPEGSTRTRRNASLEPGDAVVNNTTVADNAATSEGGGVFNGVGYDFDSEEATPIVVPLSSTIVGDNSAAGSANDLADAGEPGGSIELNYSLIETPAGASIEQNPAGQSILAEDPQLGPLSDNGGPTLTHEPASTSPAIDTGVDNEIGRDQRVELRRVELLAPNNPADDPTDIGSVERQGPLPQPGTRPLLGDELPPNCPVPFLDADTALAGNDEGQTILGTSGKDIIRGVGGEDTVDGRGGDDCLTGDKDFDKVVGRKGDDWAAGGGGRDYMKANAGDDDFNGNAAFDRLRMGRGDDLGKGGGGPDNIAGGNGADELRGGPGKDRIFGDNGDDDLRGGPDDDTIVVGGGRNRVRCGSGDDKVVVIKPGRDEIARDCELVISRKSK